MWVSARTASRLDAASSIQAVMRRSVAASLTTIVAATAFAVAALAGVAEARAADQPASHWAASEIEQVVAAGVMGPSVEEFRPDEPLTWGELAAAVGVVRGRVPAVRDPARLVTLAQLDAWLVRSARLAGAAKRVRRELVRVGLAPPRRVATETIARIAGFRLNHERANEERETAPNEPAARAEAAYSFARVLELTRWERRNVKQLARRLALPELGHWQAQVLARAMRVVGFPYVWAGSSPERQVALGLDVPGGFDCSGFTWHVYKSAPFEGAEQLGSQLLGRSSYALSGEIEPSARIGFDELQPADLVFFGDAGPDSQSDQVGHVGIYLGGGWMVHSSRRGTTITVMSDWYLERFAWGRRVLAEAGL